MYGYSHLFVAVRLAHKVHVTLIHTDFQYFYVYYIYVCIQFIHHKNIKNSKGITAPRCSNINIIYTVHVYFICILTAQWNEDCLQIWVIFLCRFRTIYDYFKMFALRRSSNMSNQKNPQKTLSWFKTLETETCKRSSYCVSNLEYEPHHGNST